MANTNQAFGLSPIGREQDATPGFQLGASPLKIASNNTTVIAKGDLLKRLDTGYVTAFTAAVGTTIASGRDLAVGIFWGCEYLSVAQGRKVFSEYWPGADASGDVDVKYIPLLPNMRLKAMVNGAISAGLVFADIGQNIDIAYSAPSVVGTRARSNVSLNGLGTSAALPFKVVGLWSQYQPYGPGSELGQYNWGVVEFNGNNITGV